VKPQQVHRSPSLKTLQIRLKSKTTKLKAPRQWDPHWEASFQHLSEIRCSRKEKTAGTSGKAVHRSAERPIEPVLVLMQSDES
jgi:hypothetical protein